MRIVVSRHEDENGRHPAFQTASVVMRASCLRGAPRGSSPFGDWVRVTAAAHTKAMTARRGAYER